LAFTLALESKLWASSSVQNLRFVFDLDFSKASKEAGSAWDSASGGGGRSTVGPETDIRRFLSFDAAFCVFCS